MLKASTLNSYSAKLCAFALFLGCVLSPQAVFSHDIHTEETAKRLVTEFWNAVQHQNVAVYSKLLAFGFRGLNINGHYDRQAQITGLENLTVVKYKLKNLKASKYGSTLVVSYDFLASGKGITSGPSIDIWHRKNYQWKLISHSYVPFEK